MERTNTHDEGTRWTGPRRRRQGKWEREKTPSPATPSGQQPGCPSPTAPPPPPPPPEPARRDRGGRRGGDQDVRSRRRGRANASRTLHSPIPQRASTTEAPLAVLGQRVRHSEETARRAGTPPAWVKSSQSGRAQTDAGRYERSPWPVPRRGVRSRAKHEGAAQQAQRRAESQPSGGASTTGVTQGDEARR